MNYELTKNEVLNLLKVWNQWMQNPDNQNCNKPKEYKIYDDLSPDGIGALFGTILLSYLWLISKFTQLLNITPLRIWAAKRRIKYDKLSWEPICCNLNSAYTDLGLAYLAYGEIEKAITCLNKSWLVYPCPVNTSYGLKLKLASKLQEYQEANNAVTEYLSIRNKFMNS